MSPRHPLVGRGPERRAVEELVGAARAGRGGALAVVADAGLGKSALLEHVDATLPADVRVLRLTGVEVESDLAYAGLATLVDQAGAAVEALDDAARAVLAGAIGAGDRIPVGLEVHRATLALLAALGADGPVLVLADDVHWVDGASLGLLTFVARRLAHDPVAVLLAGRPSPGLLPHLAGIHRLTLAPLAQVQGVDLLAGHGLADGVAAACWSATGGNPLAMVELAAVLTEDQRSGRAPLPDPIPLTGPIRDVFAARLATLGPGIRAALAIGAVETSGSSAVLARALAAGAVDPDGLRAAEAAGFVRVDDGLLRWGHPLARAALLDSLDPDARRAAHRAVATALAGTDHDARLAFHLAAAAEGPDEAVAAQLDAVAELAVARGAPSAAAAAWEAAIGLSVDDDARFERVHAAITARWGNGETERVVRVGRPLVEQTVDPARRVRLALMVGQAVVWWDGPIAGARYLGAEAARVAAHDPGSAALLEVYAANAHLLALDPGPVLASARRTAAWAAEAGDLGLPVMAAAMEGLALLLTGDGEAGHRTLDPVARLSPALLAAEVDGAAPMAQVVAFALLATERWDEARGLLLGIVEVAERTGYVGMQSYAHDQLAEIEWRQGRWAEAASRVAHVLTLAEGHDQPVVHQGFLRQARLDACRGRTASARRAAETAYEVGQRTGLRTLVVWAREVLALAALADDDPTEALRHLDALALGLEGAGVALPGLVWWQALHVETLVAVGRRAHAEAALARLRAEAEAGDPGRWAAAAVARGEGALASDPAAATAHLDRAVALLAELGAGFEVALALAARGRRHRSAGREAEATRDLADARARFEHLDARPWADRVAAEDRAAAPAPASSVAALLSDAELRVALAVSEGLTNRQAADALYLSIKTVDSHLQAIYRKLEIRSRSQLTARVARETALAGT